MRRAHCRPFADQAGLTFLGRRCRMADLSHALSPEAPTLPGQQRTLLGEHRHFVECIREDKPVISNGHFGRKVLEVLIAGYQGGRERRAISVPLAGVAR